MEPTPEFKEYIEKEKNGTATMDDLKTFLDKKYKVKDTANGNYPRHRNALALVKGDSTFFLPPRVPTCEIG